MLTAHLPGAEAGRGPETSRRPGGRPGPPPRTRPAGAPVALRLLSGAPRFHSAGIGSQAEAAAANPIVRPWGKFFPGEGESLVLK